MAKCNNVVTPLLTIADTLELLQSCAKPSICNYVIFVTQVHLHDPNDIANVRDVGVAASLSSHTLLAITNVQVIHMSYTCHGGAWFSVTVGNLDWNDYQ